MTGKERWSKGDEYEPYVGRWSRLVAARFIDWLAPTSAGRWLDVGCGTGALSETILGAAQPSSIRGVDPSEDYLAFARARITDPRTRFEVANACRLPGGANSYDYTVSGLVLNFIANPVGALGEMRRVTRPGGLIAAYVWDYAERMELMRHFWDAAGARCGCCAPGRGPSVPHLQTRAAAVSVGTSSRGGNGGADRRRYRVS